jgi:hypothetical protein
VVRLAHQLLVLIALLLMPLGMQPAAASASSHATMSMPMDHCPEQAPAGHGGKAGLVECTMACSAALPAADLPRSQPRLIVCLPIRPEAAQRLDGLDPETATPPPKHS